MLGPLEIFLIVVVILVLFGGSRLPQLMKGLGQGVREFRKEVRPEDDADAQKRLEAEARVRQEQRKEG